MMQKVGFTTEIKTIRLVLGDQLNHKHPWWQEIQPEVLYVMMEIRSETDYVLHHVQKIVAFFAAMRNFAEEMSAQGHQFLYFRLNDQDNQQSFEGNIKQLIAQYPFIQHIEYQLPDEYRVDECLKNLHFENIKITSIDSFHFMTERDTLAMMFKGKKQYLMENFYRKIRTSSGILMDENDQPLGGKWNFDHDNRKKWNGKEMIHPYPETKTDVSDLLKMLQQSEVKYFGEIQPEKFDWPITRKDALLWLEHFLEYRLKYFGDYQDAMHTHSAYLFHSRLSFAMNVKLISPLEVVKAAEEKYLNDRENISISQTEGFIRQIIGWREYMRGIYWSQMPEFSQLNFFQHQRALPDWFWTGKTKMKCLSVSIKDSLKNAYAHHIQRLMITGNFALLAGIHPDEVDKWYLGIYIDALEWVEITNTRGMSQFADGGIVGTKPYVSSAAYISKMSNYCDTCFYHAKEKVGEKACPFNSLYWHFFNRNRALLCRNPRIGMMYVTLDKMNEQQRNALFSQAEDYLSKLEEL